MFKGEKVVINANGKGKEQIALLECLHVFEFGQNEHQNNNII